MNDIWGLTTIGIAKSQEEMDAHLAKVDQSSVGTNWGVGDIMYADLDGDGKISLPALPNIGISSVRRVTR